MSGCWRPYASVLVIDCAYASLTNVWMLAGLAHLDCDGSHGILSLLFTLQKKVEGWQRAIIGRLSNLHRSTSAMAMAGVWPSNCICKPEPHMLSLYISLFTDDYQKALNPDGFKSCNDGKLLMPYEYEIDNNTMSISKKEKLGFGNVLCHSSGIHAVPCMVTLPMDMHSMRESLPPIKLRLRRGSWKRELWSSSFKLGFVVCDARAMGYVEGWWRTQALRLAIGTNGVM
ncbi:hypothetical protein Tco_0885489 [Tanacetum coccineum]